MARELFHVKQWFEQYAQEIESWNQVHRIIGKSAAITLVRESLIALEDFRTQPSTSSVLTLIDIGAGAGLLGVPWLWTAATSRAIFIEPDKKKAAFLNLYLSNHLKARRGDWLVLTQRLEDVSRETIDQAAALPIVAAARAFSGERSLAESRELSALAEIPCYEFTAESNLEPQAKSFFLKRLKKHSS